MKNKILLLFFVANFSVATSPIFALWDDIFDWTKYRTFMSHENSEQKKVIIEPEKEKEDIVNNTHEKQKSNQRKIVAIVGVLALIYFLNLKVMLGMIMAAYLVRRNAEYIDKSGAGKIIDGLVEKSINGINHVIKEIL